MAAKMAVLLLLAAISKVVSYELSAKTKEQLDIYHRICHDKIKVDDEIVEKAHSGVFIEDELLMCYMLCLMQQSNSMSESGVFLVDEVMAMLQDNFKERGGKILEMCRNIDHSDMCHKAFDIVKCLHEHDPEFGEMFE